MTLFVTFSQSTTPTTITVFGGYCLVVVSSSHHRIIETRHVGVGADSAAVDAAGVVVLAAVEPRRVRRLFCLFVCFVAFDVCFPVCAYSTAKSSILFVSSLSRARQNTQITKSPTKHTRTPPSTGTLRLPPPPVGAGAALSSSTSDGQSNYLHLPSSPTSPPPFNPALSSRSTASTGAMSVNASNAEFYSFRAPSACVFIFIFRLRFCSLNCLRVPSLSVVALRLCRTSMIETPVRTTSLPRRHSIVLDQTRAYAGRSASQSTAAAAAARRTTCRSPPRRPAAAPSVSLDTHARMHSRAHSRTRVCLFV